MPTLDDHKSARKTGRREGQSRDPLEGSGFRRGDAERSTHTLRAAFLARASRSLRKAREIPPDVIERALSASSDADFLAAWAEGLTLVPSDAALRATQARLRAIRLRRELMERDGGFVSSESAGEILGLTRQAVHARLRKGRLLALTDPHGPARFPIWQFTDQGTTLPGLEDVLAALEDFDPWMKILFFLGHLPSLRNRRALDVLRAGDLQSVLDAAASYGEQGAL